MFVETKYRQYHAGVTLIELIVFMVIVGLALAGVFKALQTANQGSVDPLVRKQALSIAASLLREVQQQPFTFCDPDDVSVTTAVSAAACSVSQNKVGVNLIGPSPSAENRYSQQPFDNVADYGGFVMPGNGCSGICMPGDRVPVTGLAGYAARVDISKVGGTAPFSMMPLDAVLRVQVTVTAPANNTISLHTYRVRYAPNI